MENNIILKFVKEEAIFDLDISQPDLAKLVHFILDKNLSVTKENMNIETQNTDFDVDDFIDILITVNEEFTDQIELFYKNIEKEIKTYYSNEELSQEIIEKIKSEKLGEEELVKL